MLDFADLFFLGLSVIFLCAVLLVSLTSVSCPKCKREETFWSYRYLSFEKSGNPVASSKWKNKKKKKRIVQHTYPVTLATYRCGNTTCQTEFTVPTDKYSAPPIDTKKTFKVKPCKVCDGNGWSLGQKLSEKIFVPCVFCKERGYHKIKMNKNKKK